MLYVHLRRNRELMGFASLVGMPFKGRAITDLSLTKRADYAMRAAICLAKHQSTGDYRKIREIADEMNLPVRYTPQIMNLLLKADLAEAKAGRKGGYRLLRAPQDIPLLEVVEAAEGPLRPSRCTLSGGPCHWERMCALHPVWEEAHAALLDSLRRRTLASVVEVDRRLQAANYPVPDDSHRLSPEAT